GEEPFIQGASPPVQQRTQADRAGAARRPVHCGRHALRRTTGSSRHQRARTSGRNVRPQANRRKNNQGDKYMDRRSFLQGMTVAASIAALPALARAQAQYPSRPISFIVPVAPGGGSDYIARTVTSEWSKVLNNATFV